MWIANWSSLPPCIAIILKYTSESFVFIGTAKRPHTGEQMVKHYVYNKDYSRKRNNNSNTTCFHALITNYLSFAVCLQELDPGRFGISQCAHHIFCHLRDGIFLNSFDIYEKVASVEARSQVLVNHSGFSYGSHCTEKPRGSIIYSLITMAS